MKKIIIDEKNKGLLFKNGRFVRVLDSGKYYVLGGKTIELACYDLPIESTRISLESLLSFPEFSEKVDVIDVGDRQLALHYINGRLCTALPAGKYAFWKGRDTHEFSLIDISSPEVSEDIPEYVFTKIPESFFTKVYVAHFQKARVFFNGVFVKLLDAGTYYFWNNGTHIEVTYADTRLTQLDIPGQEMLTQDKVTIRVNFVCSYRISDYVKIVTDVNNYLVQLHVASQLALRDYVGKNKLDDILNDKDAMSDYVTQRLKDKESELYVEITEAGVKDIILPGEIRDIMNTVLVAEKRAQANVITRREEVASTRSLLNTAKLMEENKTLYKLKELEYIERICENVGNINLAANGDILSQLASLLHGNAT